MSLGSPPAEENAVDRLHDAVTKPLKARFVDRDEVIDLIALALVAGEHLFLYGPPGTAKSALIRAFARSVRGNYFEYMLTRFSEPNEIFGPIDLVQLRQGTVATVVTNMLPEAEFAFLDELFNANSAILNNLLTVLNERVYRRGAETHRLPLLSLFSASNHLPEDDALRALFDRFLIRCQVDNLPRSATPHLLAAGWELEQAASQESTFSPGRNGDEGNGQRTPNGDTRFTMNDLRLLARRTTLVDLSRVRELYTEVVHKVRDLGIAFSDRRAVKAQKLLAASAVLSQREQAGPSDLWVLSYVWDRAEQIGPLRGLIQGVLEQQPEHLREEARPHPRALPMERADPEEIARQLYGIEQELAGARSRGAGQERGLPLMALARLREQVAGLADRAAWVRDEAVRRHLLQRTGRLLEQLG